MLGGSVPAGNSMLLAGPSGSGKSVLAAEFISDGARHDEPGIIAVFEKRPNEYSQDSPMGRRFDQLVREHWYTSPQSPTTKVMKLARRSTSSRRSSLKTGAQSPLNCCAPRSTTAMRWGCSAD